MPCCYEALVLGHLNQTVKISEQSILWVTFGQVAKDLCGNGPVMVVFVGQVGKQIIPDFICPANLLVRGFEDLGKGSVLFFSIC